MGAFGVALSEVLAAWKYFLLDNLQLSHNDIPLPQNYDLIRKRKSLEKLDPLPVCPATPSNKAGICSPKIQRVVRRVFCSYLGLLVKSKNDMALAFTLDNPNRSLGHIAFTDLRHATCNSTSSLFLTVTSFVRAIQLGGKGYAPPESHPLRKHVKALSEFLNFIDQCQVLGETSNPREAGFKLVSSIRASLVKGCSNGDPVYLAAEDTGKSLKESIGQKRETVKVLMTLFDEEALAPPCRNKAELLPEDQAVLNGSSGACLLTLYKSPEAPTGSSPKPLRNRVLSQQEHIKSKRPLT
ncbi:PCNA-interacting partner-like [Cyprinus carpio]|uniref:PCNA-interacting partner n=1 Tax=Cyprinus carpio TaxID=7962 RepID=A0A9R0ABC6_CYPCA|nr:PCNA-interacting partner-like [Cyprinus carpio]